MDFRYDAEAFFISQILFRSKMTIESFLLFEKQKFSIFYEGHILDMKLRIFVLIIGKDIYLMKKYPLLQTRPKDYYYIII